MAITNLLAPEPFWVIINNEGTVAGGAKMYTRRSQNKVQNKTVFQDPGGTIPWPNPIIFDLNGVQGPFYWTVDSADLSETYYIFVNDSEDNLIWDIDDFAPPGSGGGGNVTTFISITNYIANNQFIDHIDNTASPIGLTNLVIAPSNHKGFTPALLNPVVGIFGVVGPDIRFLKNSTVNSDQITFPIFPFGSDPLSGDVTPVDFVRYQCTTSLPGETFKCFQFPITQKVKNLADQSMTFQVWASVNATPTTLTAYVRQYFGSAPTASADSRDLIGTMSLTTTWTQFSLNFVVPDVAGKTLGTPGLQTDDDAIYIQLEMPLNTACDIFFTKPTLYLGEIDPSKNFDNYDQIDSINSTPRTGDIRVSLSSSAPNGWVAMDDRSIGNENSLATNRADEDTFQLFKTIWDGVSNPSSNTFAPVSGGLGASAVADFVANKRLTLPRSLGRALAGAGTGSGLTARVLGEFLGEETHTLTIPEIPAHTHHTTSSAVGLSNENSPNIAKNTPNDSGTSSSTGGGGAHNNMQPTSFMNIFIKL